MSKRKREDSAGEPASKKLATEKTLSAAEKRQQRSERKSKKVPHKKQKVQAVQAVPEELLPNQGADDTFAEGEDFVSLTASANEAQNGESTSKPAKANVKAKRKPKTTAEDGNDQNAVITTEATSTTKKNPQPKESSRFIVFVGNLPFSTTTPQIQHHFRKLSPKAIRHSTDKTTKKSRGFAFLEFDEYSAMKTCLKVYHHSLFDPERTAKLPESAFDENGLEIDAPEQDRKSKGRKINVELTAGGGGKGGQRKEKIKLKNEKLWEERERRKKEEGKKVKKKGERSEVNLAEIGSEAVHPSRLKRVPGRS